jgi:hypothetical protein
MLNNIIRRLKATKRVSIVFFGLTLLAAPAMAHAAAVDAYYERAVMTAANQRCNLFTPELASALAAAAAQAHGAAMRSGMTSADLDRVGQRAMTAAWSVPCNSRDIATAADRVRSAFDGYSRLQTMTFPGDTASWTAYRATSQRTLTWRLSQASAFGWNSMMFGVAGRGDATALIAAASFPDGAQPYAARLVLRDEARAPEPFLNIIRASNSGRMPLDARMPPPSATRAFFADFRGGADASLLPRGASAGTAFRFPTAAVDALARLDPREAAAVEFLFASPGGGPDIIRTAYVEVGDFSAGRAFLASAQR